MVHKRKPTSPDVYKRQPQTGENGSGWMYTYTDSLIRGVRQTNQPSPWINDYGTFSIMPLSGVLKMDHKERGVPFSHTQEEAAPYLSLIHI